MSEPLFTEIANCLEPAARKAPQIPDEIWAPVAISDDAHGQFFLWLVVGVTLCFGRKILH